MNFKELLEGSEPKMPGAPGGIKIMTPQQFVAKAGDSKSEEEINEFAPYDHNDSDDDFDEGDDELRSLYDTKFELEAELDYADEEEREHLESELEDVHARILELKPDAILEQGAADDSLGLNKLHDTLWTVISEQTIDEENINEIDPGTIANLYSVFPTVTKIIVSNALVKARKEAKETSIMIDVMKKYANNQPVTPEENEEMKYQFKDIVSYGLTALAGVLTATVAGPAAGVGVALAGAYKKELLTLLQTKGPEVLIGLLKSKGKLDVVYILSSKLLSKNTLPFYAPAKLTTGSVNQGVAEGQEQLDRIRKLSGLDEATKLPASTRDLGGQEFQDYMNRIVGTPNIDKKTGKVKVDKKGNEKFVSGKTKGDKYKMPYIHRSSVITYLSPDGQTYDEDAVKKTLAIRPKSLLKQNEKMKHSNGEFEQFFNVGFAALVGIALDEQTNNLIVVNTCPGAGSCKVDCFAMKGGKIQFKAAWQSDGRILTYLLNDPDGFFNQLSREISAEASAAAKGDKKFPNGWQTTVRWHDAGDFFSPEYLDMALKMAAKHPDVRFYAYTKMAGAALAKKPDNFIINWSEGANTEQEKQVKAQDPNLDNTKNSRIVPEKLFWDLLAKDEKGNLDKEGADEKGKGGRWVTRDNQATQELKQRLAKEYGLSSNSILNYDEYMAKRNSIPAGMKYNVIVAPGEGDVSANDPGVLSTLLLRH